MSESRFPPDDPRLTAYALGEVDASERAQIEAMLAESADAREALEAIRETIGLLRRELRSEPALTLTNSQRAVVQRATAAGASMVQVSTSLSRRSLMVRSAMTISAAAAVVVSALWISRGFNVNSSRTSVNRALVESESRGASHQPQEDVAAISIENALTSDSPIGQNAPDAVFASSAPASERPNNPIQETVPTISDTIAGMGNATPSLLAQSEPPAAAAPQNAGGTLPSNNEADVAFAGQTNHPMAPGAPGVSAGVAHDVRDGIDVQTSEESTLGDREGAPQVNMANIGRGAASGRPSPISHPFEPRSVDENSAAPVSQLESMSETQRSLAEKPADRESLAKKTQMMAEGSARARMESGGGFGAGGFGAGGFGAGGFGGGGFGGGRAISGSPELFFGSDAYGRRPATHEAESYEPIIENAFLSAENHPLSTFSIDVDTASYSNMRRFIQQGQLPPANAVRIEELVNYFHYDYPEPSEDSPFSVRIDVAGCPWNPQNKLARVGLKAKSVDQHERPATNLVFLIDVSGSMSADNKLPLVRQALSVLVSRMREDDQIAIVTYAGEAGLKLNSTSGSHRTVIQQAIDSLHPGGSTNGAAGITIAYDTAIQSYIRGGVNRVILCTDGDFNVGISDDNSLVEIIQEKAASGVFLSVFGFGMGNLKDSKLEKLADKGNGHYGYIDGLQEARKVFGEQLSGTLVTVAKDVKLQLEFSRSTVGAYRLIGYENRVLAARDFDDDTKDAGEIGAGRTVTALYEIVPKAVWRESAVQSSSAPDATEKVSETSTVADGRLFTVKLRHKLPETETSERSIDFAAMDSDVPFSENHADFRFAAAVASFGMQLRDSKFRGQWTLQDVLSTAESSLSTDHNGERTEFTDLVRGVIRIKANSLQDSRPAEPQTAAPTELTPNEARVKASVEGKYRRLLKKIEVRNDVATYGDFRDFGLWEGTNYSGYSDLPSGYWVWVYPNWYIWGEVSSDNLSR